MNCITQVTAAVFSTIVFICLVQCRPTTKDTKPKFQPMYQSLQDFIRCHGAPCEQWDRTAQKVKQVEELERQLLRKQNLVNNPKQDSSHDKLQYERRPKREAPEDEENLDPGCEWLTEKQVEAMKDNLEQELRVLEEGGKDKSRSKRQKRQIVEFRISTHLKWNRIIPFKFDGNHTYEEMQLIREAIGKWSHQTCVEFDERAVDAVIQEPHLVFTANAKHGCRSWVGKAFTEQQINLAPICFYTTNEGRPIHEIGHALGLWHQQQRQDRDEHITINWDNLYYYSSQFQKAGGTENFDVPYDLSSIMHYASHDGSKNRHPTIEAKNKLFQNTMGQRIEMSFNDAKVVNRAYCSDVCPYALPFSCQHEGYQDPNQCDRCRCPDGWTGDDCSQVKPAVNAYCGGEILIGDYPQYITSPRYNGNNGYYDNFQECTWHVKAAPGSRVVLEFEDIFGLYRSYSQVCYHWLEVRYSGNMGTPGPRLCGDKRPEERIVSDHEEMFLAFRSNWEHDFTSNRRGFKATVRAEPNPNAPHQSKNIETTLPTTKLPITKPTTKAPTTTIPTTRPTNRPTTTPSKKQPTTTTAKSTTLFPETEGLTNGKTIWTCDFDTSNEEPDWCGMEQDQNDNFDWTIKSGSTPSEETGPSQAFDGKHYIFIETSNPRKEGDKAKIWMPLFEKKGHACLKFHYNMFGFHINVLEVMVKRSNGRIDYPFQLQGQQGNEWKTAYVALNLDYGDKIGFAGFRGEAFSGDIALDAITLTHGQC